MKILIFNWQDIKNPLAGGAEVHLHEIFSRIAKKGHGVTLFCSSFEGASPEDNINGIQVVRRGGRYLFNFRVPFRYLMQYRRKRYDLVIDDMNKIPFFTPIYVREPLYIVTHHLFGKSIFVEAAWPLALYVYVMEKIGFWLCRLKHLPFIVGSPSTEQELLEDGFPSEHIEIVNYCVDRELHTTNPARRSAVPLLGYFGRLKKYKSVEHLLYALTIVKKSFPEVQLVIVGDGDNRKSLESLAAQLGVSDAVQFMGFVTDREKVEWMQKVWFAVNTSSKEGWGLTVIEANACGTTVVASDVPGLRDAVRDNQTGLLYEYGNVQDLADKIVRLMQDDDLRKRIEKNAYEWASTFDWNVAAEQTLSLLESYVKNSRQ
jgi:glycosyltransferase involved in cell wall biosynthesis